jgi:sugar phosphate isomerase/epimerase
MHRREFLRAGAATVAAAALAPRSWADGKKLRVFAYSRHLQWLRTAEEVADATIEMGYDGVELTVRPYPGHIDPEKVASELPPFVNTLRKRGLLVENIVCPINDADSPNAEQIMRAASSVGITGYWGAMFRYEPNQPVMAQLDAMKPKMAKLAALTEKYKMTAMVHTYSGNQLIGSAIWDLLYVLRGTAPPERIGFHYDIGHMTNAGGNGTWALSMRAAGPYIREVSVKDSLFELNLPNPEGGPYTGTPGALNAGRGGGGRGPGGPPPAAAAATPPTVAGRGGRGSGRGGAGGGRGGGGQTNPWRVRQVPLGEGQVDLPLLAQVLKEINFAGPLVIQCEYPNGGADNAADKITLPPSIVLGNMKKDRLTLKAVFGPAGLV